MESKAKLFGHPIHQMLIVFPLGLLATAVLFDLITLRSGAPHWSEAAFYMMGAGIIGGLAAAIFGLIDWLAIPSDTRAKAVGAWHGLGNVVVVLLFACGFMLRWNTPDAPDRSALTFSIIGVLLALVTGWLGGELMDRMGVGIDEGAHLNAPNSLTDHMPHTHGTSPGHA